MTPFVLRNIAIVNFYLYAQDFQLSGRGNAVFLGGNGSGKSVLLDAIQVVMTGMNRRYLDLNSRVSEGGRSTRTIREACLGLLDDGEGYERESCLTYIALGFEDSDGDRRCTAGVCIEAKAATAEENVLGLFLADGAILQFADFVHQREGGIEEKGWHNFLDEQRRKGQKIETFQRQNNRAFLRQLHSVINANSRGTQVDPDRTRAAMRQALSFDIGQIASVTDFVKRYLLDEAPIETHTFQARYATWRDMQKQIARVEAEIKQVEVIRAATERVMDDQFNQRLWNYGSHRAEHDRYTQVMSRQRGEIVQLQSECSASRAYQEKLAVDIEYLRTRLEGLKRQIDGAPAYEQLRQAHAEKDRQIAIRNTAAIESKQTYDALKALSVLHTSAPFASINFPALDHFAKSHLSADRIGEHSALWPASPKSIAEIVVSTPQLSELCTQVEKLHAQAALEKARLREQAQEIERMLKDLRSGGGIMSKDAQDFLSDLARLNVPACSLSEVADIAEGFQEWRGIVESILGDWVDAIIVEPRYMDKAYSLFDQSYKATRAKLVQTENTSVQDRATRLGVLAEAVMTENAHARAFVSTRLGRILRASSASDIRKGDLAASADGKYAHGRGIEYRRLGQIPRLGKSVRDQQKTELARSLSEIEPRLAKASERESQLDRLNRALKQAEEVLVLNQATTLRVLKRVEAADLDIKKQTDLIRELDAQLPQGAMEELKRVEDELSAFREEEREESTKEKGLITKIGERTGGLNANSEARRKSATLAIDAIPSLDRRTQCHSPPIGLERFVSRAHEAYRRVRGQKEHPAQVRIHFETLLGERKSSQRTALATRLSTSIHDYVQANPDQRPKFEWTQAIESERTPDVYDWIVARHSHLIETVLRNYKVQIDKAVTALVETMVHDFLSRLRANIESVERTKNDLNQALRGQVFMGEVYQIRQERDQDKEAIRYLIDRLDIVAPKATELMQSNPNPNDPDQIKIKELIDILTVENADDAAHRRRLNELADYRNYFRFGIDICDPQNGYKKISDLEQRRGKASGGQKFVPFYICLGVAAASAYFNHLGGAKDVPAQSALLLMDEAFEKLDPDNIQKIIGFYQTLGLQLIMAAPKTHQSVYQENFDTLISIIRAGRAIQATPQHFQAKARALLLRDNPMHKPRSYFEEQLRQDSTYAAE